MGPLGALLGATASTVAVKKDDLAGETVRTAAKAANAAWDVSSKAAGAVGNSPVGEIFREGLDTVESVVERVDGSGRKDRDRRDGRT